MKTIVLAAGRSLRLKPIEDKNFLSFLGKPLLQHQLEQLLGAGLKEFILVGRQPNIAPMIALAKQLAHRHKAVFDIVEQEDLEGMAGALLAADQCVKKGEDILVVNANDLLPDAAFLKVIRQTETSADGLLLAKRMKQYFPGGYLRLRKNGSIASIVEKPGKGKEPSDLVNIVVHYHRDGRRLFDLLKKTSSKRDDRYEQALDQFFQQSRYQTVLHGGPWQAVKYPWHVLELMEKFLEEVPEFKKSAFKNAEIAPSAIVRGKVWLEEGVKVLDHAAIVGPAYIGRNTVIATNALVRGSHIGDDCVIGFSSEIARSYLGNQVWTHTNYIGDSIIGNDVSFGAGCVTGNLRLDEGTIKVAVREEKVDSGRTKFGLLTGDHVRCGINTSFMPGVKIGHHSFIGAGLCLAQDIDDGKYVYGKTELLIKDNKAATSPLERKRLQDLLTKKYGKKS